MLTLKQYQDEAIRKYKATKYWENAKRMLPTDVRNRVVQGKKDAAKIAWTEEVTEYGKDNRLPLNIIQSFDREYGRDHMLHCFRGNYQGLVGWTNPDAVKY